MGVCTCSLNIYSPPGKWRCDSLNLYPVVELGVSKYGGVSQPFVPHTQKVIKHPPVFGMDHHAVSGPSGQNGPCQGWAARGSRHGDTRNAWEAMSQNWSLTLKRRTCKHQQYPLVLKHGWGNTEIYSWANHLQMEKCQASHVSLPAVGKWLISIYHHIISYLVANIWFINGF